MTSQRLNFSHIAVNVCVGLSSELEIATARYVEIIKLIREILIEIAPLHGTSLQHHVIIKFRLSLSIALQK